VRIAVDTNVFSALFSGDAVSTMQAALERVSSGGIVVVSPVVYAGLVAGRSPEDVGSFFSEKGI
jgi:predicted nucleic acid-binding protein